MLLMSWGYPVQHVLEGAGLSHELAVVSGQQLEPLGQGFLMRPERLDLSTESAPLLRPPHPILGSEVRQKGGEVTLSGDDGGYELPVPVELSLDLPEGRSDVRGGALESAAWSAKTGRTAPGRGASPTPLPRPRRPPPGPRPWPGAGAEVLVRRGRPVRTLLEAWPPATGPERPPHPG